MALGRQNNRRAGVRSEQKGDACRDGGILLMWGCYIERKIINCQKIYLWMKK
jgi:hypothetical protein